MLFDIIYWLGDILSSINQLLLFIGDSIKHTFEFLSILPDAINFLFDAINALPYGLDIFATGTVIISVLMLVAGVVAGVFL